MCKHFECLYYSPRTETCDYILFTGHSRGCPPTDDCTKLCSDPKGMIRIHSRARVRTIHWDYLERLAASYRDDIDSKVLAMAAKVPYEEAYAWMCKVHPENPTLIKHFPYRRGGTD